MPHHNPEGHADVVARRVRTLTIKLGHPSAQCLTAEQYERMTLEVRTLYWLTRGVADESHEQVLSLIRRIELLDPARDPDIHIPRQITPVWTVVKTR
ncbi:hypothetical protein FKR81_06280 [Lentzea tibetensis]|uniref:Uncharacterized protein n=1 Tax=Lentzea tibetensis TaxID=2591470 RepID=A0A563F2H4_9PSEU|nr:hypothetical protein [Lentzea tibetensis]TWP53554.1 hypothetical protein FKR81_06280 [Lentzea tibetensis]